ncbi:MAG: magnesium transporter CorA family protein, partial [bacterium]|nr:magnesium transporter CorA family protein [bacterium]
HHITKLDNSDVDFLRDQFQFHVLDFEDLGEPNPIPKLDLYTHYLFAVFQIPCWEDGKITTDDLEVFLGADFLVTVTKHPIDSVEKFFLRSERNAKFRSNVLGRSPGYLLYKLLRYAFYNGHAVVTELAKQVNEIENSVYNVRDRETTRELAMIRRNIMFLQTSLDPQRSMVSVIGTTQKSYVTSDLGVFFDDVRDALDTIWMISKNLKQVIDGLFEVNDALLTHRTNDIVTLFTALAASLMPPTLLAGIYGMNVDWLPFRHSPYVLVVIFALSLLSFFGVYHIIQRHR